MNPDAQCSDAEIDEAAVWIARLRAPDRTLKVERGFRRWLDEKSSHAAAFDTATTAWELSAGFTGRSAAQVSWGKGAGSRIGLWRSIAVTSVSTTFLMVVGLLYIHNCGVTTNVGEQRVMTLEDGSRISLNTASRMTVRYTPHERRVELKAGEALFEIAKLPDRPFIVAVGSREIKALGTAFLVRDDDQSISVTLVEGKVAVSGADVVLVPGQRLTLASAAQPQIDRPPIEKVMAWRRGQVELEETPLKLALVEMNRYSNLKVVLERPDAESVPINGVFRAGDSMGFASAVARFYGLKVERRRSELVLAGVPNRR